MFLDVIFNYYNWTGVLGIKSNEELRLFEKSIKGEEVFSQTANSEK
jgi:hypothetical protein